MSLKMLTQVHLIYVGTWQQNIIKKKKINASLFYAFESDIVFFTF